MPAQGWDDYLAQLRHRKTEARSQGGPEAIARAHRRGKLTARERLTLLLDEDSFHEIGLLAEGSVDTPGKPAQHLPADGVVTGWGTLHGRIWG